MERASLTGGAAAVFDMAITSKFYRLALHGENLGCVAVVFIRGVDLDPMITNEVSLVQITLCVYVGIFLESAISNYLCCELLVLCCWSDVVGNVMNSRQ